MTDNKYNRAQGQFRWGRLIGHHEGLFYPPEGRTVTDSRGNVYQVQKSGALLKIKEARK